MMTALEHRLLNDFQRDFPLVPEPYRAIADALGTAESDVIASLRSLRLSGKVGRVGAVFRPGAIGASTLAAIAVPEPALDTVARYVSSHPGVNHNYSREHGFNLWFVAAAANRAELDALLGRIGDDTGLKVLDLPLLDEFHIDLGFDLSSAGHQRDRVVPCRPVPAMLDRQSRRLADALTDGLALSSRPYAELASRAGMREDEAIAALGTLTAAGTIKRFGVIVRHRALGYLANAMVIFDVPDGNTDAAGRCIASLPFVNLCYRRERRLPAWPYNLFCMIHGRERAEVERQVSRLRANAGLLSCPHAILFSRTCYTQRAARYAAGAEAAREYAGALHG